MALARKQRAEDSVYDVKGAEHQKATYEYDDRQRDH